MRTHTPRQPTFWHGPSGHTLEMALWFAFLLAMVLLHARSAY